MSMFGLGLQELLILLVLFGSPAGGGAAPPAPATAAPAPAGAPPADLALIHPGAIGFAHVRVAEIWADPSMEEVRRIFRRAGPKAIGALDEQFSPRPSTLERVSAVVIKSVDKPEPAIVGILRFSEPIDVAQFTKLHLPEAEQGRAGGKVFVISKPADVAVYFADGKTLLIGEPDAVSEYLAQAPEEGGLRPLIDAAGSRPFQLGVNLKQLPIPPQAFAQVPEVAQPLLKAQLLNVSMALGERSTWDVRLLFPDAASAADGEKSLKRLAELAKTQLREPRAEVTKMLFGERELPRPLKELPEAFFAVAALGGLAEAEEYLDNLPVNREGASLALTLRAPSWLSAYSGTVPIMAGLLLPAVQKVRSAAGKSQSMNNLKQIGLAMHMYHDIHGHFPPAAITDKAGKKLLSWRVAILPFIEQEALYKQFKLDEPWDSAHNKKLASIVVKVFADPNLLTAAPGLTPYKAFVGPEAAFTWAKGRRLHEFTDGTSNTVLVVTDSTPVVWTKPDDIEVAAKAPIPVPGPPVVDILTLFGDGSVRSFRADAWRKHPDLVRALVTPSGGEVIDTDEFDK